MRSLKTICLLGFFLYAQYTSAQSNQEVFKQAAESLFAELSEEKEALLKEREALIAKLPKEKTEVVVMGMPQEQAEQLETEIEEIIDAVESGSPPPPPPPPPPPKPKKKKTVKRDSDKISFTSSPMFPNQELGYQYAESKSKDPKAEPEKIEWVSTGWHTTTETINIEDIKDPIERKKWEGRAEVYDNTFKLTRINFLEAVVKECQTQGSFKTLIQDLKNGGHNFDGDFKKMKALNKAEQGDFIKQRILSMANKIAGTL